MCNSNHVSTSDLHRAKVKTYDLSILAKDNFTYLHALLKAISNASDKHSHIRDLANLGCFIAGMAENDFDCEAEELKAKVSS